MPLDLTATRAAFLAHFAETVTVVPPTGDPYEIDAVVDRDRPGPNEIDGSTEATIVLCALNDADEGIPGATLNTKSWRVRLPLQVGQAAVERRIKRIVSSDAGIITLEIG